VFGISDMLLDVASIHVIIPIAPPIFFDSSHYPTTLS